MNNASLNGKSSAIAKGIQVLTGGEFSHVGLFVTPLYYFHSTRAGLCYEVPEVHVVDSQSPVGSWVNCFLRIEGVSSIAILRSPLLAAIAWSKKWELIESLVATTVVFTGLDYPSLPALLRASERIRSILGDSTIELLLRFLKKNSASDPTHEYFQSHFCSQLVAEIYQAHRIDIGAEKECHELAPGDLMRCAGLEDVTASIVVEAIPDSVYTELENEFRDVVSDLPEVIPTLQSEKYRIKHEFVRSWVELGQAWNKSQGLLETLFRDSDEEFTPSFQDPMGRPAASATLIDNMIGAQMLQYSSALLEVIPRDPVSFPQDASRFEGASWRKFSFEREDDPATDSLS